MATHDYDIANQSGANFRADLNNVLDAIVSNNSNSSDPSTTFAYMWWVDTSNNVLKLRNSANNAWITLPMSITASNTITPTLNMGTGAEEDVKILYDGNAKDFYIALDDSADVLIIGEGSTVGTNAILTITDDSLTIGDGSAVDTKVVFDGNAQDYYIALDDSADDLIIGRGSTVGTTPNIQINESNEIHFSPADSDVKVYFGSEGGAFGGNSSHNIRASGNDLMFNSADDFMYESGGTEVMRLLNDGNLLLGTTSASASEVRIDVRYSANPIIQVRDTTNDVSLWMQATDSVAQLVAPQNGPLAFGVGASQAERMRIDHNGKIMMNHTSAITDETLQVRTNQAIGFGILVDETASAGGTFMRFRVNGSIVGQIFGNGSSTTFLTSSDATLKDVTGEARGLEVISELNPVSFTWKKTGISDEGFIAQEVDKIIPSAVHKDAEDMYSMDYGKVTPYLVKAIQEQQEQIEALQSEINTLKGA